AAVRRIHGLFYFSGRCRVNSAATSAGPPGLCSIGSWAEDDHCPRSPFAAAVKNLAVPYVVPAILRLSDGAVRHQRSAISPAVRRLPALGSQLPAVPVGPGAGSQEPGARTRGADDQPEAW